MGKRRTPNHEQAMPAELVLGKEDPTLQDGPPGERVEVQPGQQPQSRQQLRAPHEPFTLGDRIGIAAVSLAIAAGCALYFYRHELGAAYERRVHPERYWSDQAESRRFDFALLELHHRECMVNLSAARTKEPITVERYRLIGFDETSAVSFARAETEAQLVVCERVSAMLERNAEDLGNAERELARERLK